MTEIIPISQLGTSGGELLAGVAAMLRFPATGEDAPVFGEESEVEVTITRDSDGAEVAKEAEVKEAEDEETKATIWTVELSGEDIPEVDILTAVWTDGSSSYTTQYEVVGGFVVSLAAIEEQLGEKATTAELTEAREIALREIEGACGVPFRPRYAKERLSGSGTRRLVLEAYKLLRIISVEVNETILTEAEVEELIVDPIGVLISPSWWPGGRANIKVAYVHGYQSFPAASLPVRDLAAYYLTKAPLDWNQRATSVQTELGTYSLVTPGVRGANFPLPSVNAFCSRFEQPLVR